MERTKRKPNLPTIFLDFFWELKQEGIPLTIRHYEDFIFCFIKGFGDHPQALKNLLQSLWVPQKKYLKVFDKLYEEKLQLLWEQSSVSEEQGREENEHIVDEITTQESDHLTEEALSSLSVQNQLQKKEPQKKDYVEVRVYENESDGKEEDAEGNKKRHISSSSRNKESAEKEVSFLFTDHKHFPFSIRKNHQELRRLKQQVRPSPTDEININATIDNIVQQGFFYEFIWEQEKISKQKFILLHDHSTEMIPFQPQLMGFMQLLKDNTRFTSVENYYFTRFPIGEENNYRLFTNKSHTVAKQLNEIFGVTKNESVIFILSDGGSIKKDDDLNRTVVMRSFIKQLFNYSARVLWLNPLPEDKWKGINAAFLSQLIPMFPMHDKGIKKAIEHLKRI